MGTSHKKLKKEREKERGISKSVVISKLAVI